MRAEPVLRGVGISLVLQVPVVCEGIRGHLAASELESEPAETASEGEGGVDVTEQLANAPGAETHVREGASVLEHDIGGAVGGVAECDVGHLVGKYGPKLWTLQSREKSR